MTTNNKNPHNNVKKVLTSIDVNGIRLPRVFAHVLVNKVDNIRSNGSLENGRQSDSRPRRSILVVQHRHQRTSQRHRLATTTITIATMIKKSVSGGGSQLTYHLEKEKVDR